MNLIFSFNEYNNNLITIDLDTLEFMQEISQDKSFTYSDFKYFSPSSDYSFIDDVRFFICKSGNEIVGVAHIRKSPYVDKQWWLSYLSIKEKSRNIGYASALSECIFKYFKDNNLIFETSSYSDDGFIKLKPLFNRLAIKYGVVFVDKDRL